MSQPVFIKQEEALDIEDNLEEQLVDELLENASFETTLSAIDADEMIFAEIEEIFMDDKQLIAEEIEMIEIDKLIDTFNPQKSQLTEPNNYTCKLCSLDFTALSSLYRHYNSQKHKRLEAVLYQKSYALAESMMTTEQPAMTYNVVIDGASYKLDESVQKVKSKKTKVEARSTDDISKGYFCKYCSRPFTTSSNLRRHENLHIPRKIYTCSVCYKTFKQREYWRKHTSVHVKRTNRIKLQKMALPTYGYQC